ncbi:hypothetical protein LCGC14_3048840 [marine sediment metagenome]|uniref:Uncharacterized protein n=1 Tax=marine sediment metagenome TaxID=412755 RepID=A0A0F8WMT9_9ZZZZ
MVERNVTVQRLAFLCKISARRIQQLTAEGIIKKTGRDRYKPLESMSNYIGFLQKSGEEIAYCDARTQKMRADADKSIMEAAQLAGRLIPAEIVAYNWNHMTGAFRAKLLNLPKKTAPLVQHESSFTKCNTALQDAIHECLAELSEYQPPAKHFTTLEQYITGSTTELINKPVGRKKKKTVKRKQRRAG